MVGKFFKWWLDGLRQSLPTFLHRLFLVNHPRLLLQFDDNNLIQVYWQAAGTSTHRGHFCLDDSDKIPYDLLLLCENHSNCQVDLRLNTERVLSLQKYFPEAVRDNLAQTVHYQLDRLTPFAASDVYFDTLESEHGEKPGELLADIFVVPKQIIQQITSSLADIGITQIHRISLLGASDQVNLANDEFVDSASQTASSHWPFYFFGIALLLSLSLPIAYKSYQLNQLDDSVKALSRNASQQLKIREQLQQAEEAVLFLKDKRANAPMALDIVEQLSTILPMDSWLNHLSLDKHQLQLKGLSENALSLIDILEASAHFSQVKFISPVTRDKKSQRDRFHVQAKVEIEYGQ